MTFWIHWRLKLNITFSIHLTTYERSTWTIVLSPLHAWHKMFLSPLYAWHKMSQNWGYIHVILYKIRKKQPNSLFIYLDKLWKQSRRRETFKDTLHHWTRYSSFCHRIFECISNGLASIKCMSMFLLNFALL